MHRGWHFVPTRATVWTRLGPARFLDANLTEMHIATPRKGTQRALVCRLAANRADGFIRPIMPHAPQNPNQLGSWRPNNDRWNQGLGTSLLPSTWCQLHLVPSPSWYQVRGARHLVPCTYTEPLAPWSGRTAAQAWSIDFVKMGVLVPAWFVGLQWDTLWYQTRKASWLSICVSY